MTTADWLMIKYFHGKAYHSHCNKVERIAVVFITCDPGEQRVRFVFISVNIKVMGA